MPKVFADAPPVLPPKIETDVLIVGGGPVGLALAVELGSRGVDCQLLEHGTAINDRWTRAMNFNMRTMEHFRRWGLADTVRHGTHFPGGLPPVVAFCAGLQSPPLARVFTPSSDERRGFEYSLEDAQWIAQGQVQRILLSHSLGLSSVRVAFGHQVADVGEDSGGVTALVRSSETGTSSTIKAKYVVGCDGGRSAVRTAAGIQTSGNRVSGMQYHVDIDAPALSRCLRERGVGEAKMYFLGSDSLIGILRPFDGVKWDVLYTPQESSADAGNIDMRGLIGNFIGLDVPFEILGTQSFFFNDIVADVFASGRMFIAGDAAHLIPPFGGHNLNNGIEDAVNIGWKLAAVLKGWSGAALLESYSVERRRQVGRVRDSANRNFAGFHQALGLLKDASRAGRARNPDSTAETSDRLTALVHSEFNADGIVLDIRYDESPVVVGDGSHLAFDPQLYQASGRPGHRAPIKRGRRWGFEYADLGDGYSVINFDGGPAVRAGADALEREFAKHGVPVRRLAIASAEARHAYGADLAIVRPDQHVAWRGMEPVAQPRDLVGKICAF